MNQETNMQDDDALLGQFILRRGINSISKEGMALMFRDVPEHVKQYARIARDNLDWKFYAVDQSRGRCYYGSRIVTIPMFAIHREIGYKTWYIAHELSHVFDLKRSNHGQPFMEKLQEICPPEFVHYELGYKPRNAAKAGIRPNGFVDPFDLL